MDGNSSEKKKDGEWDHAKNMDIWDDNQTMVLLNGRWVPINCSTKKNTIIKKSILHYQ